MDTHAPPPFTSSYPESRDSSPCFREIDADPNLSFDEPPSAAKVKLLCSYGGRIQPRPHDHHLVYAGGDTKLLSVDRSVRFSALVSKLSSLAAASEFCLKYQLPGEDLDALVSVINDEDLEHMLLEHDRLCSASAKPARLRLFLFALNSRSLSSGSSDPKSEPQWLGDALDSAQAVNFQAANPDYLFGFDKVFSAVPPPVDLQDFVHMPVVADYGLEHRRVAGEQVVPPPEIQQQIQALERAQISDQQQEAVTNVSGDVVNPGACTGEHLAAPVKPEKLATTAPAAAQVAAPVQLPAATHFPEWPVTGGGMPLVVNRGQAAYYIPAPAGGGYFAAIQPVTGPIGQGFYGVQRQGPELYREQALYNAVQPQQAKVGAYGEGIQVVQQPVTMAEAGFPQVVYYTAAGGVVPAYQAAAAATANGMQGGGALTQDGKVVGQMPQTTAV
ncbi:PB1 domain-containing protein [Psidium guajava]|nr:PB1 domain-containing protein [Psidium guajava]